MFSAATRRDSREPVRSAAFTLPARRSLRTPEPPRPRGSGAAGANPSRSQRSANCRERTLRTPRRPRGVQTPFRSATIRLPARFEERCPPRAGAPGGGARGKFFLAGPFPHIVVDDFLPEPVARLALEHFPRQALQS